MDTQTIVINPIYLKALVRIAAKQDIRYYLNGVLFQATPEGKFYVATDGHRIAVFHEGWGTDKPSEANIIIPRQVIEQMQVARQIKQGTLTRGEGVKWTLDSYADASLNFTPIEGKYPEWRRIFPEKVSGAPGDYNMGYVADFVSLAQDAGDAIPSVGVLLWQNGIESAVVTTSNKEFIGLLMPVRVNDHKGNGMNMPQWVEKKLPQAA